MTASHGTIHGPLRPGACLRYHCLSHKGLVIGGLVFRSAVTLATALSQTCFHLVVLRALQGLGEAFFFPASMSLISDYHGRETRSRATAVNQSGVYAGTIAGGAVAGLLAQLFGWRASFYFFGALGVLLGVALLGLLREPVRGQSEEAGGSGRDALMPDLGLWASIREAFFHPMSRVLMAVFLGANFVAVIFLTWMPSFQFRKFNMSLSMAGLNATAYLQIASVCGAMTGGWLADRLARRHAAGCMWTQSLGPVAGVPFIFLTGWAPSVPALVLGMTGFGFAKGLYDANIWASLYDVVKPERRGTALGFMNSMAWLGGSASSCVYIVIALLLVFGIRRFMTTAPRSEPLPAARPTA